MTNPNNCETCNYKKIKSHDSTGSEHCYMFREAPTEVCMAHTGRQPKIDDQMLGSMKATLDLLLRSGYCGRIK